VLIGIDGDGEVENGPTAKTNKLETRPPAIEPSLVTFNRPTVGQISIYPVIDPMKPLVPGLR